MSYSLYERVTDHIITAPRWYHHAQVKAGLACTVAMIATAILSVAMPFHVAALVAGVLSGPGVFGIGVGIKVRNGARSFAYWRDHGVDQLVDFSDHLWSTACCLVLAGFPWLSLLLAGACGTIFYFLHQRAVP